MPVIWCSFLKRKVLENLIAIEEASPEQNVLLNYLNSNCKTKFQQYPTRIFMIGGLSDKIK
jgi:hypothetical protein